MAELEDDLDTKLDEWRAEADSIKDALDKITDLMPAEYAPDWMTFLSDRAALLVNCADEIQAILDIYA